MRLLLLLLVLGTPCVVAQEDKSKLRTWTSSIGTKIEAELVSSTGKQVTLKTKAGRTLQVPINKLSKADQEFIAAKSSSQEPAKGGVPVNSNLKYRIKGDAVTITGCDKTASGALTIPATMEGRTVTSIGNSAFRVCTSLTGITIPDSVTSIGNYAFWECSRLTSITIPDSVTSIGEDAFERCTSLTTIEVGAGNVNYTGVNGVLFNKEKTTLCIYPAAKTGANYVIPDSVTSIRAGAFGICRSLTTITIPDGVTSIGGGAFGFCTSLTSITIPNSVTSIGTQAFYGCESLTSITIPDSVTSIGKGTFSLCTSLTGITIPDSVTSIGDGAFTGCSNLTGITIPDSVTSIGMGAFGGCSSLRSITIPDSVTSIGDNAFIACKSLTAVTFLGDAPKVAESPIRRASNPFREASPTIYRKPEAKGWGDKFAGRPVKLISEKP